MHVCKCRLFTEEGSHRLLKCLNYCFSVLASATNKSIPSHAGLCRFKALLFLRHLKVQAGIKMNHSSSCQCCVRKKKSDSRYEFGAHATATLQFAEHSSSNYVNLIVWPLIAAGVALVLIVLLTFHCIKGIRKKGPKEIYTPVPLDDREMDIHEKTQYISLHQLKKIKG